ncbi:MULTISPECIES: STAS domain-containing protein [Caldimonas]|uniref:STAS domain-containing protein n=1 Tax=Caldimonas TaxID=196013 RepID=UPI00036504F0|nr:STAS domain-containing protein [Caldimonas manganoxidans]
MPDSKDNAPSFIRKVVRFVTNPTTDWAELSQPSTESRESEYAKSELKAMIERKRRNDFVRKREFDMLRKVRREGLTDANAGLLDASSNLDELDLRGVQARSDVVEVKAKIDEIEQQMVGEAIGTRRSASFYNAPTQPVALDGPSTRSLRAEPAEGPSGAGAFVGVAAEPPAVVVDAAQAPPTPAPSAAAAVPPAPAMLGEGFAVEVNEVVHDPELDEAVIAFANADFDACEQALAAMVRPGASRAQHADTWMVLFDLYRATGQQAKFESLALDYAQQFGWSAPQWFSLPRMVAEAAAEETPKAGTARLEGPIGWTCPAELDVEAVARLRSQSLQMPLPWVLDWSPLRRVDAEAAAQLSELLRHWAREPLEMHWLGGEHLLHVLGDAAPTGVRDADPALWLLRLDVLRLVNRPDQFDEVAIDYCVTYEVSPPSWESARCVVKLGSTEARPSASAAPLSVVSDVSTSFVESQVADEALVQMASLELSGQLVGDISETLSSLESRLGKASIVNVSCSRLIRVDFIAAGDLLNWVLNRRNENRHIVFDDTHRLVALFFGAMGITEHARVKVRNI